MRRDVYNLEQVTGTLFKKPPVKRADRTRFAKVRLAICAAAAVAVLIGAVQMVPRIADVDTQDVAETALSNKTTLASQVTTIRPVVAATTGMTAAAEVTRADTALLDLPQATITPADTGYVLSSDPLSLQLRQPVRLSDRSGYSYSLSALVTATLSQFGAASPDTGRLKELLVQSLAQGLSDHAIKLAVDAALDRRDFEAPEALRTVAGGLDTSALLTAMVAKRLGKRLQITAEVPVNGVHVLGAGDSLAGLALKYYGQPTRFDMIAQRNHKMLTQAGGVASGESVIIPSL